MISKMSHAAIFVLDQQTALEFTGTNSALSSNRRNNGWRVQMAHSGTEGPTEFEIILMQPAPPMYDEPRRTK
jgi:hypothetical protein